MSQTLPNMLENTIAKIKEMIDVNSVIGAPITTPDGVTIIPVSKVSVGFGGGGSDYAKSSKDAFGGGAGGGGKSGQNGNRFRWLGSGYVFLGAPVFGRSFKRRKRLHVLGPRCQPRSFGCDPPY